MMTVAWNSWNYEWRNANDNRNQCDGDSSFEIRHSAFHSISRRPSSARLRVSSSANSSPLPAGRPKPMREIFSPAARQPLRQIIARRVAFHVRAERDDDFADRLRRSAVFPIRRCANHPAPRRRAAKFFRRAHEICRETSRISRCSKCPRRCSTTQTSEPSRRASSQMEQGDFSVSAPQVVAELDSFAREQNDFRQMPHDRPNPSARDAARCVRRNAARRRAAWPARRSARDGFGKGHFVILISSSFSSSNLIYEDDDEHDDDSSSHQVPADSSPP